MRRLILLLCLLSTPCYASSLWDTADLGFGNPATYKGMNLILQSQTFNTTWTLTLMNPIGVDSAVAPDGTTTADTLIPNTNSNYHYIRQAVTVTAEPYTFSVYAKPTASGYNYIMLVVGAVTTMCNTSTGVVVSNAGSIGSISASVEGYYRCAMTFTPTAGSKNFDILVTNNSSNTVFAGNGTAGQYAWGAQLERGSSAHKYLVTTTTPR